MQTTSRWTWLVLSLAALTVPSCRIPESGIKLRVPFREQERIDFCGPACVQMWRAYDGLTPEVSQLSLYSFMGGQGCGVSAEAIVDAVSFYTLSRDAYWDIEGNVSPDQDQFLARQISSIDAGTPVIGLLGSLHAVVVDGGKWHRDTAIGYDVWDFVYVHDPLQTFGDSRYGASQWIDAVCSGACSQVISAGASAGWQSNLQTYGGEVWVRGLGGIGGGGPHPI